MRNVSECLICGKDSLSARAATFAPFLAERIWSRPPFHIKVLHCGECEFSFADARLDPDEEAKLYRDYRGRDYLRTRNGCEPWYTEGFNNKMSSPETLALRRAPLEAIFRKHVPAGVRSILDFGGDRGELLAGLIPGASTYVYDISGTEPARGVGTVSSLDECAGHAFDLIACSNVLEHVASPRDLIESTKRIAPKDALVFLEVPAENPFGPATLTKRCVQQAVLLAARPRLAVSLLPFDFTRLVHEHVNFFSLESLVKLLTASGFPVVAQGSYPSEGFSFGPYKLAAGKMVWAIARAPGSHSAASVRSEA